MLQTSTNRLYRRFLILNLTTYLTLMCSDFRRKMEIAKTRMKSLQQKQKETMKMASLTKDNDSK